MTSYPISRTTTSTHYVGACEQFEHLIGSLKHPDTQNLTHGEVEALIHTQGMELVRRLNQAHLDQRNAEEPVRERVVDADGIPRTHRREGCERRLETRFGEVIVRRRGYGARGLESVFALDAELNLPPDKPSHGLREQVVEEVIRGSFEEAVRRDPDQRMRWVVLTDGQEDLLRQVYAAARRYKVDIIVVQDFVHVLEYLWKAAYSLHPETAEEREGWVMDRARAVLQGRA